MTGITIKLSTAIHSNALILFRHALGLIIICRGITMLTYNTPMLISNERIFDTSSAHTYWLEHAPKMNIFLMSNHAEWAGMLILLYTYFAFHLFLSGRRPDFTVCCYLFLFNASLNAQLHNCISTGDSILSMLILFNLFLPCIDENENTSKHEQRIKVYQTPATLAVYVATIAMYVASGFHKLYDETWMTRNAMQETLLRIYGSEFGEYIALNSPSICMLLQHSTFFIELFLPFALVVEQTKLIAALVLFSFHLGINFAMEIGLFPYYNMCLLLLFLPPFFSSYIHHNDNQKDSNVLLHEDTEVDEKQEEVVEEEKILLLKKKSNSKRKNTRRKRSKTPLRAAVNTPSAEDKKSPLLSVSKTKSNKRSKTPQRNISLREDTSTEKPRVQEETNQKYQHPVVDGITKKKKVKRKSIFFYTVLPFIYAFTFVFAAYDDFFREKITTSYSSEQKSAFYYKPAWKIPLRRLASLLDIPSYWGVFTWNPDVEDNRPYRIWWVIPAKVCATRQRNLKIDPYYGQATICDWVDLKLGLGKGIFRENVFKSFTSLLPVKTTNYIDESMISSIYNFLEDDDEEQSNDNDKNPYNNYWEGRHVPQPYGMKLPYPNFYELGRDGNNQLVSSYMSNNWHQFVSEYAHNSPHSTRFARYLCNRWNGTATLNDGNGYRYSMNKIRFVKQWRLVKFDKDYNYIKADIPCEDVHGNVVWEFDCQQNEFSTNDNDDDDSSKSDSWSGKCYDALEKDDDYY